jgi:sensor domain CHASE-containing protein
MAALLTRYRRIGAVLRRADHAESRTITCLLGGLIAIALLTTVCPLCFLIWRANLDANARAASAIAGALDRDRSRISNETYINSAWDDAADHAYGTIDARWAQSQWGTPIARNYVIDAHGATLFSHLPEGAAPPLKQMVSAQTLLAILTRVPAREADVRARRDATVLLGRFGNRPALIAFSPIVHEKGAAPLTRATYRIFVDVLLLDDKVLSDWAKGFNFAHLHWTSRAAVADGMASTDLKDWRGDPLGTIAWPRLRPATGALYAILPILAACAALFFAVAGAVTHRVLKLNRNLIAKTNIAEQAAREQELARVAAEQALADAQQARREGEEQARQRIADEARHRHESRAASLAMADQLQARVGPLIHSLLHSAGDLDGSADATLVTIVGQQGQAAAAHDASTEAGIVTSALLESLRTFAVNVDVIAAEAGRSAETTIKAASHSAQAQIANETLVRSVTSIERSADRIAVLSQATNLLALNATMEAARAGEAGRGFAVVAQEVKNFSQQTAGTTREISDRINEISASTASAVSVNESLRLALDALASSAVHTAETTSRQRKANADIKQMIGTIEANMASTRDTFASLKDTFVETASVAHRTRTISAEMRVRAEALQAECDRIVAMLRGAPQRDAQPLPAIMLNVR